MRGLLLPGTRYLFTAQVAIRLERPCCVGRLSKTSEMKNKTMTEDGFLSARVADERPVHCWLSNGIKLEGTISAFDAETIFMRLHPGSCDENVMMIFKMQIASIAPTSKRNSR